MWTASCNSVSISQSCFSFFLLFFDLTHIFNPLFVSIGDIHALIVSIEEEVEYIAAYSLQSSSYMWTFSSYPLYTEGVC
jgi:hypothetical protein